MIKKRKAISPVVATVLLIAIVVILALIIFLWAKGFITESVQKKGENADSVCGRIQLEMVYLIDSGELQITNIGNIPIYSFYVKAKLGSSTRNIAQNISLGIGQSMIVNIDPDNYQQVSVVPVILGQKKSSVKNIPYTCKTELIAEMA